MAKNKLSKPAPSVPNGSAKVTAPQSPSAVEPLTDELNLVRKFTRENPKGSLADTPEEVAASTVLDPSAPIETSAAEPISDTPPPAEETPAVETPAEPAVETPAPTSETTPATPAKPAPAAPAATTETPATPAVATEPPKPSYAPDEKIDLLEGNEAWTRQQIVTRLQQFAEVQPKAAESERFRALFGNDYETAEKNWKPILDSLRENPERAQVANEVLAADPGMLEYLRQSAQYWKSLTPEERGVAGGTTAAAAPSSIPQNDPRIEKYERTYKAMEKQVIDNRVRSEWGQVYEKYPFMRTDQKAREALTAAAGMLFSTDERAGKDPLECRGLLEAMSQNAVFLEAAAIAYDQRAQHGAPGSALPAPTIAAPPSPGVGLALLGSSGPGPSGQPAAAPPKVYRGDPDSAVAAFINDHPR